jgi:hypothetical protein
LIYAAQHLRHISIAASVVEALATSKFVSLPGAARSLQRLVDAQR